MKRIAFMSSTCRECGTPLFARSFRSWNDDGTVTARFSPDIRVCQVETEMLAAIFEGLTGKIGYPVDRVVIQGQRRAMRKITEDFFRIGHGSVGLLAGWGPVSRVVERVTRAVAWTVGHALPEEVDFRPGESYRLRMRNPYNWQLMVGDVWGGFEALHNVTAEAGYEVDAESLLIEIRALGKGMTWDDPSRLQLRRMGRMQYSAAHERCARCGVPLEVPRGTMWDITHGRVFNKVSGRREATIMVEPLTAMLRELENELGDEVPRWVQEIVAGYTAGTIPPGVATMMKSAGYRCSLDYLRAGGMGHPSSVEMRSQTLTVRIDNPFCGAILAGMVSGMYTALEGLEARAWWASDPRGFVIIEVNPA